MRAAGLIGLVLALLVVGVMVKKQLGVVAAPTVSSSPPAARSEPSTDARTQSRQIQQQFKQSLDAAIQPRSMPDGN